VKHIEEEECRIRHYSLVGAIQHKELIRAYLSDPTILNDIMDPSYAEAAQDNDETGGVSLMEEDVPNTEMNILIPESVDTKGGMPLEQQTWPSLSDASKIPTGKKSQKSGAGLVGSMDALKIQEQPANETINMLEHQFWNPESEKYSPDNFLHPIEDHYTCPFPLCR
jgi:hypothetical protein